MSINISAIVLSNSLQLYFKKTLLETLVDKFKAIFSGRQEGGYFIILW